MNDELRTDYEFDYKQAKPNRFAVKTKSIWSRVFKSIILPLLVLAGLISIWYFLASREYQRVVPKSDTVSGHFELMPEPEEFRIYSRPPHDDRLVIIGPMRSVVSFPSGNPIYIFERDGKLTDWTSDWGDDNRFSEKWVGVYQGKKIDRETVEKWLFKK